MNREKKTFIVLWQYRIAEGSEFIHFPSRLVRFLAMRTTI